MPPPVRVSQSWFAAVLYLLWLPLRPGPARAQATPAPDVWQQQLRFPAVRAAQAAHGAAVWGYLRAQGLDPARLEIFIRAFKIGRRVEVWGRPWGRAAPFGLLHSYCLAGTSGTLGPKLRADDGQIPEGCYAVDRLHPASRYHLALGLDYPTTADRARSAEAGVADPGGDIFIHGGRLTVGCLPLTDAGIEELYLLAVAARASGQTRILVHIFPFELSADELSRRGPGSPHRQFWLALVPAYAQFAQTHQLPPDPAAAGAGTGAVRSAGP